VKARSASPPLARNIAFNVGARGVLLVLSIAITPVLVRRLGTEQYGIYALATGLGAGLTNILALGLIPGIVAMLSRALAEESAPETEKIVGTAFTLFAAIGSVGGVALAILVPVLVNQVLRIPADLRPVAATALWLSAVGLGLNLVFAVFNAIPYALQRYDVIAGRLVGLSLVSTAATVVYVLVQASLTGVMVIQVVAGLAGTVLYFAVSRRQLAGIRLWPGFDRGTFRRLASFTAFKSLGDAALIFEGRFDQFAIGSLLSIGAVGVYAVPAIACQRILQLLGEVAAPMYPRMSAARDDSARREVLVRGSRLVALAAAPMTAVLLVLAEPILRTWIGGDQGLLVAREATGAFRLLAGAMFLQAVVVVAGLYCESIQRPVVNNSFTVLGAVVLVPAVLLAIPRYGIAGAAGAVLLMSLVQSIPLLVVVADRVARVGLGRFLGEALAWPVVSAVLAGALGFALSGLATGALGLLAVGLAMGVVYLAAAALTGAIRAGDLAQARKVLPARWAHLLAIPGLERLLRN
jgi:O-antigen/teichoic acid export membrane protein